MAMMMASLNFNLICKTLFCFVFFFFSSDKVGEGCGPVEERSLSFKRSLIEVTIIIEFHGIICSGRTGWENDEIIGRLVCLMS